MADRIVGLGSASPGGMALAPGGDPEIIGSFSDSIQVGSERLRSVGKYDIFIARLGLKSAGVETSTAPPPSLLYPNPARDVVRVRGARAGTRVRVFAIDGGCLLDVDYRDGVDIGGLPRGVYVIEAGGRGGLVVRE